MAMKAEQEAAARAKGEADLAAAREAQRVAHEEEVAAPTVRYDTEKALLYGDRV
jgi:hypothetical protein